MLLESSLCKPGGLGARDTLRLEMGYPLYGHELTHDLSPTSFSERAFINFKKDFIGKNNVLKELNNPSKKIIGIKFNSKRAAREGDSVFLGNDKIGIITSGSISPSLERAIAIAKVNYHETFNSEFSVKIRDKNYLAEVCTFPFYKDGTARN